MEGSATAAHAQRMRQSSAVGGIRHNAAVGSTGSRLAVTLES